MQNKKRLFIASPLPQELVEEIERYQCTLPRALRAIPTKNLHVTLVFLGWTEEDSIPEIEQKIQETIENFHDSSFMFRTSRFEPGPDKHFPRLVWLSIKPSYELVSFQKELAEILGRGNGRPFAPHITVARIRRGATLWSDQLTETLIENKFQVQIKEIMIMQSTLKANGAEYTILKKFQL